MKDKPSPLKWKLSLVYSGFAQNPFLLNLYDPMLDSENPHSRHIAGKKVIISQLSFPEGYTEEDYKSVLEDIFPGTISSDELEDGVAEVRLMTRKFFEDSLSEALKS